MDEKETNEKKPITKLPENLTELYMLNRQEMLNCPDEYTYYRHLMESISIGSVIIEDDNGITKEIEKVLSDKENYPHVRNMDYKGSSHIYSCSSGDGSTGKVTVRPEELMQGESSLRNQQANVIIRRLTPLDRRIFSKLLEKGLLARENSEKRLERELNSYANNTA